MNESRPSWLERNWMWVVGCGCLGLIVLGLVLAGGLVFGVTRLLTSSPPYKDAVALAQADPRVVSALGEPIEAGLFVKGSINTSGSSGDADLEIPLEGSKGSGVLYVTASREAGEWSLELALVEIDDQRIDLLAKAEDG